jgi:hypothetical protein
MIEEDRQGRARARPAIFEHAAFAAGAGGLHLLPGVLTVLAYHTHVYNHIMMSIF